MGKAVLGGGNYFKGGGAHLFRGRLEREIHPLTKKYLSSLGEDRHIFEIDLKVIQAHCLMLKKQGYLLAKELKRIISALKKLKTDFRQGKLEKMFSSRLLPFTDIHPIIEQYLIDTCGIKIGGKVNLGRSRNDQIVTDLRIYLREEILELAGLLSDFIQLLLNLAKRHSETLFPGYTHRQPAQVTTYAHYLLSYVAIFLRSFDHLEEVYQRVNLNPLGAGALAGTSINLDRKYTTKLLQFNGLIENSMDAVSSRDFLLEGANAFLLLLLPLSRMAKDLVGWSSFESGMIELSDEFTDISTAMPQKKNPSVLELLLGKTHLALGLLNHLYSTISGLETGYNQELQELKPSLWQIVDITKDSIKIMQKIFLTLKINQKRIEEILEKSYLTAVDLAEYLQKSGKVSTFREAHFFVGNLVKELSRQGKNFAQVSQKEIEKISRKFFAKKRGKHFIGLTVEEMRKVTDPSFVVKQRKSLGGPAPEEVKRMWEIYQKKIKSKKKFFLR